MPDVSCPRARIESEVVGEPFPAAPHSGGTAGPTWEGPEYDSAAPDVQPQYSLMVEEGRGYGLGARGAGPGAEDRILVPEPLIATVESRGLRMFACAAKVLHLQPASSRAAVGR